MEGLLGKPAGWVDRVASGQTQQKNRGKQRRILLVSQHTFRRRNLAFLLDREGYDVVECAIGARARDAALKCVPDLIILDAALEDLPAFSLCEALADEQMLCGKPILMLSLDPGEDFHARAAMAGAQGALVFPADAPEIIGAIDNAMAGVPPVGCAVSVTLPAAATTFYATVLRALPGRRVVLGLPENASVPVSPRDAKVSLQRLSAGSGPVDWQGTILTSGRGRGVEVLLEKALDVPKDVRQATRVAVELSARYRLPSGVDRVVNVSNLSIAGMRITGLPEQLEVGQNLAFVIFLGIAKIEVSCEIRWVREMAEQGLSAGIAFRDLDTMGRDQILKHLFRKASA